jgi:hypothetical protein
MAGVAAYVKLVEEYRHGDSDRAIAEVISWKPEAISDAIQEVERAEKARLGIGPATDALVSFPAAVMLHTEAGLFLNWRRGGVSSQWLHAIRLAKAIPVLPDQRQWLHAIRLAELQPITPEQMAFLRAWYHALGVFFLGSYWDLDAIALLETGLERFPDDVSITLALGQAYETRGTFSAGDVLESLRTDSSKGPWKERKYPLREAETIYRGLLTRDPLLSEARLRLGRVLAIAGRDDLALTELRLAATSNDARLRYLAHLFAGDALRRSSQLVAARPEFKQALDAWPGGQAAALSLAETLHSLGERRDAASELTTAIEDGAEPTRSDPFRAYSFGDRADQKQLLEAVRAMARK